MRRDIHRNGRQDGFNQLDKRRPALGIKQRVQCSNLWLTLAVFLSLSLRK